MTLDRLLALALLLVAQPGCLLTRRLLAEPRRTQTHVLPDTEIYGLYGAVRTDDGNYHLLVGTQYAPRHVVGRAPEAGTAATLRVEQGPLPVNGTPIDYEWGGTGRVRADASPAPPDPDLARAVDAEASPMLRSRNGIVVIEDPLTGEVASLVLPRSRVPTPRNDSARFFGRLLLVPLALLGDALLSPVWLLCGLR